MPNRADTFTVLVLLAGTGLLIWGGQEVWVEALDRMIETGEVHNGLFAVAQLLWIAAGGLLALALELGQHRTRSSTVVSLVIAGMVPAAVLVVFWLWSRVRLPDWLFPWAASNGGQAGAGLVAGLLLTTAALRTRRAS